MSASTTVEILSTSKGRIARPDGQRSTTVEILSTSKGNSIVDENRLSTTVEILSTSKGPGNHEKYHDIYNSRNS